MQTIYLDADDYGTAREVHGALQLLLGLPEYYGMNADALYDCLSERREPVSMVVRHEGNEEVAAALEKISRVVEDLEGSFRRL